MISDQTITENEVKGLAERYQVSTRTIRRWQSEIGDAVRKPEAVAAMLLNQRRAKLETLEAINQQL